MRKSRANRWHAMHVEDVLRAFSTNRYTGLSERTASKRRVTNGGSLWITESPSALPTLTHSVLDYATILLLLTVGLTALFGKGQDAWNVFALLIFSIILRAATHFVSHKILLRAMRYKTPRCRVMRDGECCYLFADEVVEGDILLFSPGDTVTCDVRLISGALEISETYFSKNRRRIEKNANDLVAEDAVWTERSNTLFAASTVISGKAVGVAVAVGERTYAYAHGGYIRVTDTAPVETLRRISLWGKNASLWMILISVILLFVGLFTTGKRIPLDELFLSSLALVVASMSEFLNTVAVAFLACSMQLLQTETQGSVRIKSLRAVEDIGHSDWIVFSSERYFLSGHLRICSWLDREGNIAYASPTDPIPADVERMLYLVERCTGNDRSLDGGSNARTSGDLHALIAALRANSMSTSPHEDPITCLESVTHNSLCTAHVSDRDTVYAYVCGSVDDVLACCSKIEAKNVAAMLTAEKYSALELYAREEKQRNRRTIAVARRVSPFQDLSMPTAVQNNMTFLGCFSVEDAVEQDVKKWVNQCRAGGIRIAVFCNDAESAKCPAEEAGILTDADIICTAGIDSVTDALTAQGSPNLLIQSTAPDREKFLCEIRDYARGIVYVGDRLADLPCLKHSVAAVVERDTADVVEALSRRSDVVVHRGGTEGVWENSAGACDVFRAVSFCRNALANLRCAAMYLLITQTLRIALMMVSVLTELPLFPPVSILFLGCVLDYLAVMLIAFRKPKSNVLALSSSHFVLPGWKNGLLAAVGIGVLSGMLISLGILVIRNLSWVFDPSAMQTIQLLSAITVSAVAVHTCTIGSDTGEKGRLVLGAMHVIYLMAVAAALIGLLYVSVTRYSVCDWRVWMISIIPAIITFVMLKLYKRS